MMMDLFHSLNQIPPVKDPGDHARARYAIEHEPGAKVGHDGESASVRVVLAWVVTEKKGRHVGRHSSERPGDQRAGNDCVPSR